MKYKYLIPVLIGAMLVATIAPASATQALNTFGTQLVYDPAYQSDMAERTTGGYQELTTTPNDRGVTWISDMTNNDARYSYISGREKASGATDPGTIQSSMGQLVIGRTVHPTGTVVVLQSTSFCRNHMYSTGSDLFFAPNWQYPQYAMLYY
jgi:hypothetical protein